VGVIRYSQKEIKLIFIYHQSEKYKIWQAFIFDQENKGSKVQRSEVQGLNAGTLEPLNPERI